MTQKEFRKPGPAQKGDIVRATTTDDQEEVLGVVTGTNPKNGKLSVEGVDGMPYTCYPDHGLEIFIANRLNEFSNHDARVLHMLAIKYSASYKEDPPFRR